MGAIECAPASMGTSVRWAHQFSINQDNMKILWIICLGAGFGLASLTAQASLTLDWSAQPQGTLTQGSNGAYSETFALPGGGKVEATVQPIGGAATRKFGAADIQTPAVTNTIFSGGLPSRQSNLSIVALFHPTASNPDPLVQVTLDFLGYPKVSNVHFSLFDVDAADNARFQDRVTFLTPGATLTGSSDNTVSGNVALGTRPSPNLGAGSGAGNVGVTYSSLPSNQIQFDFDSPTANEVLHGIGIGAIAFTPVPEASQLAIGLAACALGAFWFRRSGLRRANGGIA